MITVFWGARHGQSVTSTLVQVALALAGSGQPVHLVDADPDSADLAVFKGGAPDGATFDGLMEDAERAAQVAGGERGDLRWPEWTPWHGEIDALLGNPRRQVPLTTGREAARMIVEALRAADAGEVQILCDIGSGLRDYVACRLLSLADRVVVVARTGIPDVMAAQTAIGYISPRLRAEDRVLAVLGSPDAAPEILRGAEGWRVEIVPEAAQVAAMRGTGQVAALPRGKGASVTIAAPEGVAERRGRRGWRARR